MNKSINEASMSTEARAIKLVNLAEQALNKGAWPDALAMFLKALELRPRDKYIYVELFTIYSLRLDYGKAHEIIEQGKAFGIEMHDLLVELSVKRNRWEEVKRLCMQKVNRFGS